MNLTLSETLLTGFFRIMAHIIFSVNKTLYHFSKLVAL